MYLLLTLNHQNGSQGITKKDQANCWKYLPQIIILKNRIMKKEEKKTNKNKKFKNIYTEK